MLVVTGATGQLGRLVVKHLLTYVPASRIGVSTRDTAPLADLAAQGIRVRQGDYSDPASLRHAFEGAERILMISSNAGATGGDTRGHHRNGIEAAKAVGAERLLYTAQISTSAQSQFPPGRDHAATEEMLEQSGLAWTSLRHGFYSGSVLLMNRAGIDRGVIAAPQDGKVSWATHDDLAAADAAFLAGKVQVDGPTAPLTGAEALDLAEVAALAGDILGRPVAREIIGEEALAQRLRSFNMPEQTVEISLPPGPESFLPSIRRWHRSLAARRNRCKLS